MYTKNEDKNMGYNYVGKSSRIPKHIHLMLSLYSKNVSTFTPLKKEGFVKIIEQLNSG